MSCTCSPYDSGHQSNCPLLNSRQEPEEELVHVGWFCWRAGGHLAEMACRSDCVPIHVPKEWEKDMREYLRRLEEDPDE